MTTFKVGDKVRFKLDQSQCEQLPQAEYYAQRGTVFTVLHIKYNPKEVLRLDNNEGWYAERFELVTSPMPVNQGRWGAQEPVTANSPRKISQSERALIEARIATRRKLRGDFS